MIIRDQSSKAVPLNLVGSSTFGRYPKISIEKTYNMFASDAFLVDYAGYQIALPASKFRNEKEGRAAFNSTKLDRLVIVLDANVYLVDLTYDEVNQRIIFSQITFIGSLQTSTGVVYITENNKPQQLFSDNQSLYIYDPTQTPPFQVVPGLNFVPGYITFHETYFLCAASQDQTYDPPANNTWRLSLQNEGLLFTSPLTSAWPDDSMHVGLLQTKPDNTQAVVRFPSKGNMIFVMGSIVTEAWNFTAAQLFPYQRQNQFSIDYGCLSPATVAYMDEIVVWLGINEKSGPIILYSMGGMPQKVTTDGIDYMFAQLQVPSDSQAFIYRQDGHLFYHINFYTDNLSLYVDFLHDGTHKIYHACDQNLHYFIAAELAFFDNQYYFVSRNTGNLYAFDSIYTTYQDTDLATPPNIIKYEIPRIRTCKNVRNPSQDYFIVNDIGFTIETGETDYKKQDLGPIGLLTQDGQPLITQFPYINFFPLITQNGMPLITQNGMPLVEQHDKLPGGPIIFLTQSGNLLVDQTGLNYLISQNTDDNPFTEFYYLIAQQHEYVYITPAVDLSLSYDGGATFGNEWRYELNGIGNRRNRLIVWWQCGIGNDVVCQFKFWGLGRFVVTDGIMNIRT